MELSTFGLWAFGVLCGVAVMWFYGAYKESKELSGVNTDKNGGGGGGPKEPL
jgi:hypothetical protein